MVNLIGHPDVEGVGDSVLERSLQSGVRRLRLAGAVGRHEQQMVVWMSHLDPVAGCCAGMHAPAVDEQNDMRKHDEQSW